MPISTPGSPVPRSPQFLSRGRPSGVTVFGSSSAGPRVVPFFERPGSASPAAPMPEAAEESHAEVESLAPPLPPPPPQAPPEFAARLAEAIGELRRHAERIGEQTQADAVEMAVIIARRILERELATGTAPLFSLVQSAVRRLGEARKIVVRLCPADAAAVEAAGEGGPLSGLAIARVEILQDSTLSPGDCIVDGEHGTVDGRLQSRLEEVRRIVSSALAEQGEAP